MRKHTARGIALSLLCIGLLGLSGCATAGRGAAVGALVGAGAGALIGHNSHSGSGEGALIGAAVGALGGALIGDTVRRHREGHAHPYSHYDHAYGYGYQPYGYQPYGYHEPPACGWGGPPVGNVNIQIWD